MSWDEQRLLEKILHELRAIRRELKHEPTATLTLNGEDMSSYTLTLGQSANFVLGATLSDGSTPSLSSPTLTASDSTITIVPNTSDPSGLTFTVSAPTADSATSFTLNGSASVSSPTFTAQTISNSWPVTLLPGQTVTATLTLTEVAATAVGQPTIKKA